MRAPPVLAGLLLSVTTFAQAPTTLFDPAQAINRLIFVTSPLANAHSTLSREQGFARLDTNGARAELGGLTINRWRLRSTCAGRAETGSSSSCRC